MSVQKPTPPILNSQGTRAFINGGRELQAETAQSAQTITLKLVIGSLTRVILIILSTINLQLQGQFVSIFLPLILGIVAASIVATVWSSCT